MLFGSARMAGANPIVHAHVTVIVLALEQHVGS
jgi:hypothetical protein